METPPMRRRLSSDCNSSGVQCHHYAPARWTGFHELVGGDEILEGEAPGNRRPEQPIGSQLVDPLQRLLHRVLVALQPQVRLAGKIQHAMAEELQVLLE